MKTKKTPDTVLCSTTLVWGINYSEYHSNLTDLSALHSCKATCWLYSLSHIMLQMKKNKILIQLSGAIFDFIFTLSCNRFWSYFSYDFFYKQQHFLIHFRKLKNDQTFFFSEKYFFTYQCTNIYCLISFFFLSRFVTNTTAFMY